MRMDVWCVGVLVWTCGGVGCVGRSQKSGSAETTTVRRKARESERERKSVCEKESESDRQSSSDEVHK